MLLAAASAHAQNTALAGFRPTQDYRLQVDGKPAPAQIYHQGERPALLVIPAGSKDGLMVDIRVGQVNGVDTSKLEKERDGSIDFLAGALGASLGSFTMSREGAAFTVKNHRYVLTHTATETPAK